MCRNIKVLYNFEPRATDDEVYASSLQFVRKISGFRKPSKKNQIVFDQAVDEVALVVQRLIDSLTTETEPRNRQIEAAKSRERIKNRYES